MKIKTLVTALVAVGAAASLTGCTEGGGQSACYAADGQNMTSGSLYLVDKTTGVMTTRGAVGYSVGGLALNDGKLYGVTTTWQDGATNKLISIDPVTGAGKEIGLLTDGAVVYNIADIAFSEGELYGWVEASTNLVVKIDLSSGFVTVMGQSDVRAYGNLADVKGTLVTTDTSNTVTLYRLNKEDALMVSSIPVSTVYGCSVNAMSYDSENGMLYGLDTDCNGGGSLTDLVKIDPATGATTSVASYGATNLDALACY